MAYREGEELRGQVARSKGIPVKRVVINLAADCTTAGLIAARHPSASSGQPHVPLSVYTEGCFYLAFVCSSCDMLRLQLMHLDSTANHAIAHALAHS